MVEASVQDNMDPQTIYQDLKEFEEALPKTVKPSRCAEHKFDHFFIVSNSLDKICQGCIVSLQSDLKDLVPIATFFEGKYMELKKAFSLTQTLIKNLQARIEAPRQKEFLPALVEELGQNQKKAGREVLPEVQLEELLKGKQEILDVLNENEPRKLQEVLDKHLALQGQAMEQQLSGVEKTQEEQLLEILDQVALNQDDSLRKLKVFINKQEDKQKETIELILDIIVRQSEKNERLRQDFEQKMTEEFQKLNSTIEKKINGDLEQLKQENQKQREIIGDLNAKLDNLNQRTSPEETQNQQNLPKEAQEKQKKEEEERIKREEQLRREEEERRQEEEKRKQEEEKRRLKKMEERKRFESLKKHIQNLQRIDDNSQALTDYVQANCDPNRELTNCYRSKDSCKANSNIAHLKSQAMRPGSRVFHVQCDLTCLMYGSGTWPLKQSVLLSLKDPALKTYWKVI